MALYVWRVVRVGRREVLEVGRVLRERERDQVHQTTRRDSGERLQRRKERL